jgi:hypothetical protein
MKLIKMKDEKLGLFALLPAGPQVIDVAASLGVFAPHDPLSNGLLNGVLKDGCNWTLIVKHWAHLRSPLKKLARIAATNPDHPQLFAVPFTDEPRTDDAANPIVALDITDIESFEALDPTGRRAMEQQFMNRPEAEAKEGTAAATEGAQVISFNQPNKPDTSSR